MKIVGPDMEVMSIKQDSPVGTIGVPVRDHMNAATATSLITSVLSGSWFPQGSSVDFNIVQGSILTSQRNELVLRMRGDWLLFIDDDMTWQPGAIGELIAERDKYDLDILGGLCFRRSPPHQPTLYMREAPTFGAYNFLEKWEPEAIVEVDATGMAFVVIHKRVFERMVQHFENKPGWNLPPHYERQHLNPPNFFRWEGQLGEDLRFCQDAKLSGSRVFVHTGLEIGHVSEINIGSRHFLLELAQRDDDLLRARRAINDKMGLPTLEREEAWQALGFGPTK